MDEFVPVDSWDPFIIELHKHYLQGPPALPWFNCDPRDFPFRRLKRRTRAVEKENDSVVNGVVNGVNETAPQKATPPSWADLVRRTEPNARLPLGDAAVKYLKGESDNAVEQKPNPLPPRGLINTGNICFMNCVLQSLVQCRPFYELMVYFSSKVQFKVKSSSPILDGLVEFIREYGQNGRGAVLNGVETTNPKKLAPYLAESFYNTISNHHKFKHLQRGRQEDAEEFLGYLLDALDDELREAISASTASTSSSLDSSADSWVEVGKHNRHIHSRHAGNTVVETPISHIFGGRFKSVLSAPNQKSPSVTYDPFQHVQLDISEDNVNSIQDALDFLFHPETIPYKTGKGFQVNATKQISVDKFPKVLIVHLKRFSYMCSGEITKVTKPIELTQNIHMSSGSVQSADYSLFSVVYHHGPSTTAGHYTVDLQTCNSWIGIDDIAITNVTQQGPPLDSKTAYLLFYIRK